MNQAEPFVGSSTAEARIEGQAVIVAGPTCSGKSALAIRLAQRFDGVVINADSMQVYGELRILTARPSQADQMICPHRLYGVRPAAEPGSVAWWRDAALAAMRAAWREARLPILCGGTGLYFAALTDGLTAIPDPGEGARGEARALLAQIGAPAMHVRLEALDSDTAATLRPSDGQRIARAWEVLHGTGSGLAHWRRTARLPPAPARFSAVRLAPPRPMLLAAIAERFETMLEAGAVDEVASLLRLGLSPALPAMRAIGVPELAAMLRGEIAPDQARLRVIASQSRYTKRQATWFAHHELAPAQRTDIFTSRIAGMTQDSERKYDKIISFIQSCVDEGWDGRP